MIKCISAITLATHDMARAVRFYRALGLWEGDTITWFWIGSHAEYDTLLARL